MIKPFYDKKIYELENENQIKARLEAYFDFRLSSGELSISIMPLSLTCDKKIINEVIEKYRAEGWKVECDCELYSFVWHNIYNFLP